MPWPVVKLGEICTIDRHTASNLDADDSQRPYIGLEQVASDAGDINLTPSSRSGSGVGAAFCFDNRHVLYGKLRPYLNKVATPAFAGRCSMELVPLLPMPNVNREFLAWTLRQQKTVETVMHGAVGARMPRADMELLMALPVTLPPLYEQRRIVDILNHAASIRRLHKEAREKAREIVPALLVDMFGDPAQNPLGQTIVKMDELIESGPQNGLYVPESCYGSGTKILRIDGFYNGEITGFSALRRIDIDADTVEKYRLRVGDIIINRVNSRAYLGKSAIVREISDPVVFESNMMRLSLKSDRIDPRYLIAYLQTAYIRDQVQVRAKDAINQSSINQTDVRSLLVMVPPLPIQRKFAIRVDEVRSIFNLNNTAIEEANRFTNSLMQKLMSSSPERDGHV